MINIINDVSGSRYDERILEIVKKYNIPYILTHSRGDPTTMLENSNTNYNYKENDYIKIVSEEINEVLQKCRKYEINE